MPSIAALAASSRPPFFVKRDLDGFFGLFIDNLVQLIVIVELTTTLCGLDRGFIYSRILPGTAISVIVGNIYYAVQARGLARRQGRTDVTALPFGINTPSVFAFIFFIMAPIYATHRGHIGSARAAHLAWQVGLVACFGSGLIEFFGAFFAEWVRRATPRAALISALAGIAIGFISMDFILRVFEHPLLALVPLGLILMQYFSGARLPWGVPAGLAALLVGTALGWGLKAFSLSSLFGGLPESMQQQIGLEIASMPTKEAFLEAIKPGLYLPHRYGEEIYQTIVNRWSLISPYLSIVISMGLFNLVGSLQNIESAEAAGDKFQTLPSLAVNGLGTMIAAGLGSCFPTTIYIGHVGWKHLGARTGYSWLNGLAIAAICIFGLVRSISVIVPLESVIGILVWIAIIISAQAFQTVPRRHAPAVVLGLIPGIAAWGLLMFNNGLGSAGQSLMTVDLNTINKLGASAHIGGLIGLEKGFIISSMGLAAVGVMMIERRFIAAAVWTWILAVLSFFGIIHAWDPSHLAQPFSLGIGTGWRFAAAYFVWGLILFALSGSGTKGSSHAPEADEFDDAEAATDSGETEVIDHSERTERIMLAEEPYDRDDVESEPTREIEFRTRAVIAADPQISIGETAPPTAQPEEDIKA